MVGSLSYHLSDSSLPLFLPARFLAVRKKDAWRLDVDIGFLSGSNGDENARNMGDGGNLKRSG